MSAWEQVLAHPRSIKARRGLAMHWRAIGDPRAELIEKQLAEYDGLGADVWEVLASIDRLIETRGREWAGRVAELAEGYSYALGLVSGISISGANFVEHASELVCLAPIIDVHVSLPMDLSKVLATPELKQIARLSIEGGAWLGDREAEMLASWPHLTSLRSLSLVGGNIGQHGYARLAGWMNLREVVYIELSKNPCAGMSVPGGRAVRIGDGFYIVGDAGLESLNRATEQAAMSYHPMDVEGWPPVPKEYLYVD